MNKMKDYTADELIEAIEGSFGIVSRVANTLKCNWNTAKKYIDMYPEAKEALLQEHERALDVAESKIFKAINLDDVDTAKWYLSRKGKSRGYGDKIVQEVSGPEGEPIKSIFILEIPADVSSAGTDTV